MPKSFSSKIKLLLKKMMKSIKEFQQILKLCEMIVSLILFYVTKKNFLFLKYIPR